MPPSNKQHTPQSQSLISAEGAYYVKYGILEIFLILDKTFTEQGLLNRKLFHQKLHYTKN